MKKLELRITKAHKVTFESYDYPVLYLEYCGIHWAYNAEYGSWLNLTTNKCEEPPLPLKDYMRKYYQLHSDEED